MKQQAMTATRTMSRPIFVGMCYAYMFLGACSVVAGILVYVLPLFLGLKHAKHIDAGVGFLIVVLVGFGLARIGTAIKNLRRIKQRTGRSPVIRSGDIL